MGIISAAADTYYTYRFIRTLVQDWKDTDAYKLGIIDDRGNPLKKVNSLNSQAEKNAYTLFHRLVYNIKRTIEILPFGRAKLANFAAALYLVKEELNLSEGQLLKALEKVFEEKNIQIDNTITESFWNVLEDGCLAPGSYILKENIAMPSTGELVAKKGSKIIVDGMCESVDNLFGTPIYKVKHATTKMDIYVTPKDIAR